MAVQFLSWMYMWNTFWIIQHHDVPSLVLEVFSFFGSNMYILKLVHGAKLKVSPSLHWLKSILCFQDLTRRPGLARVNNNNVKRTRMLWHSASCRARLRRHPDWAAALSAPGHTEDTWFILFYHNRTLGFTIVGNSWSAETLDGSINEALFGMSLWPWKWSGAPEAWVGSQNP